MDREKQDKKLACTLPGLTQTHCGNQSREQSDSDQEFHKGICSGNLVPPIVSGLRVWLWCGKWNPTTGIYLELRVCNFHSPFYVGWALYYRAQKPNTACRRETYGKKVKHVECFYFIITCSCSSWSSPLRHIASVTLNSPIKPYLLTTLPPHSTLYQGSNFQQMDLWGQIIQIIQIIQMGISQLWSQHLSLWKILIDVITEWHPNKAEDKDTEKSPESRLWSTCGGPHVP